MPFMEKKSFSMPFMCGVARLPEVQVSERSAGGVSVSEVNLVMVDQSKRNLPEGTEKLAYTLEGALKAGVARDKVNTVMLYPNSVNLVQQEPQQQQQESQQQQQESQQQQEGA